MRLEMEERVVERGGDGEVVGPEGGVLPREVVGLLRVQRPSPRVKAHSDSLDVTLSLSLTRRYRRGRAGGAMHSRWWRGRRMSSRWCLVVCAISTDGVEWLR